MMRRIALVTSLSLSVLFGTMALAQRATYDYDPTANFSTYKTYAWTRGTELPDELNHGRLLRAIDAQLAAKGLTQVDAGAQPDVLVAYHASFDKNLQIQGFETGFGPFGLGDRMGSARVQDILVGALVVDLIDARTRKMVWRAMASGDINPGLSPEKRDKAIAKATERMFKHYPPKR